MKKQLVILSSPSGGGKSTVARHLLKVFPQFKLSVSATTREKRPNEINGKDYYFLSKEEFEKAIANDELIEYEQIFGNYYGTLKSQVNEVINRNDKLLFDIDVKGALSLKKLYPELSILIFLSPPSLEVLEDRLRNRKTETEEQIHIRYERAQMELAQAEKFDYVVINDNLEQTYSQIEELVKKECL